MIEDFTCINRTDSEANGEQKRLSREQRVRYSRNISVEGIGEEGQLQLLGARVFVLGCGALGSVAAAYLAGAGVGHITIADFDTVDISNLQRQLTFSEQDAGRKKASALEARLRQINSEVEIDSVDTLITPAKAEELFSRCDFILDASDNPDTKYMTDSVCRRLGLPYSIAGVLGLRGQVMTHVKGTAGYSDFFPESAGAGYTPCSIGGVLGPLTGIIGSIQALECIKYITKTGSLLTDRLLLIDGRNMKFSEITI